MLLEIVERLGVPTDDPFVALALHCRKLLPVGLVDRIHLRLGLLALGHSIHPFDIGSQWRGVRNADPFPRSPFNPCVRLSRTRLTDDLRGVATRPAVGG